MNGCTVKILGNVLITNELTQSRIISHACGHTCNITVKDFLLRKLSVCYTVHLDWLNLLANIIYLSFSAVLLLRNDAICLFTFQLCITLLKMYFWLISSLCKGLMYSRVSTTIKCCSRHFQTDLDKTGTYLLSASIMYKYLNNILVAFQSCVMTSFAFRLGCWAGLEGRAVRRREAEDGHGSHVLPQVRRNSVIVVCHYTEARSVGR